MDWTQLEHVLEAAAALPADQREAMVRERCAGDPELLDQALSLIRHIDEGAGLFSALASDVHRPRESGTGLEPSDRIGPYTLVELLGEGGMGRVWLADQREPVRRRVALKVIRMGMDTREIVARFESERQALAVMDHPGIARVFDGGVTDGGRPYFVMELVDGVRITEYCDTHRLTTDERVRLFIRVCDAVQHAHLKGVIHRDLKPSNVLVATRESGPVPKVIDFGVAKAVTSTATDDALVTQAGQLVGTPAYMSPEQAGEGDLDIDSRSDVYALGVMLYELLSGVLPFESGALKRPGLFVHLALDVPTPSARLSSIAATQETVAGARGTDVRRLRRQLRGDLDWIVMKAMHRDRDRRYDTARELAQDLERFLVHLPVSAGPPTRAYRLRRFVRRNRAAVIGAAATAAALLFGIAGTSLGLIRAQEAEAMAQREAATAEAVSEFLSSLFSTQTPAQTLGRELRASELLEIGADRVRRELAGQPLVQAAVLEAVGDVLLRMGRRAEATPLLEESLALRERTLGAESIEAASTILVLARNAADLGLERRRTLLERALTTFEREEGEGSVGAIRARQNLAIVYQATGAFDRAEELLREAEAALRLLPPGVPLPGVEYQTPAALLGRSLGFRADLYATQGRMEAAMVLREEGLALLEASVPPDDPYLAAAYRSLAGLYRNRDRRHEAREMLRRALASTELVFGPWSEGTADALIDLGRVEQDLGLFDDAERRFDRSLAIRDSLYGGASRESAQATWNLGRLALARGSLQEAERAFDRAIAAYEGDPPHRGLPSLHRSMAVALERQGRLPEAIDWARRAVDWTRENHGWTHTESGAARRTLARLYVRQGAPERAAELHEEAADSIAARFGSLSRELGGHLGSTASWYRTVGEHAEALRWVDRAITVLRAAPDARSDHLQALQEKGIVLSALGLHEPALRIRQELVAMHRAENDDWALVRALEATHLHRIALGQVDEAAAEQAEALALLGEHLDGVTDTTRLHLTYQAALAHRVGAYDLARDAWERALNLLSPGTDSYLVVMLESRAAYDELLDEIGDLDAMLHNAERALAGWEGAPEHQRRILTGAARAVGMFEDHMVRHEARLRELGRMVEADAVQRRMASR